jgi:hypothetical protein
MVRLPRRAVPTPQPPPPWSQRDFGDKGDFPLALGAVYGVRWWSLDRSGWLKGIYATWQPEINEARCEKPTEQSPTGASFRAWARGAGPAVLPGELSVSEPEPCHEAPDENCACGFYAFWEPEPAPVRAQFPVAGVIEGTGRTLIGSRGFRCARARILALHIPVADDADAEALSLVAEVEDVLSTRYVVPVYATMRLMLLRHPPTADYTG